MEERYQGAPPPPLPPPPLTDLVEGVGDTTSKYCVLLWINVVLLVMITLAGVFIGLLAASMACWKVSCTGDNLAQKQAMEVMSFLFGGGGIATVIFLIVRRERIIRSSFAPTLWIPVLLVSALGLLLFYSAIL